MVDGGLVNRRTSPRPPGVPVGCRRVVLGRGADAGFRVNTGRKPHIWALPPVAKVGLKSLLDSSPKFRIYTDNSLMLALWASTQRMPSGFKSGRHFF